MTLNVDNGGRHYLREWRLAKGLTQSELARRADTDKSEISRLELGTRRMTLGWMSRLTKAMGINRGDLIMLPPTSVEQTSQPPSEAARLGQNVWSIAMLGDIPLGVGDEAFQLATYSGDDWPGMFTPGDMLIIDKRKSSTSAPGLYAITIGDEIIIRRIVHADSKVVLSCGNPAYQPTSLSDGLTVAGRVVGHIRRM